MFLNFNNYYKCPFKSSIALALAVCLSTFTANAKGNSLKPVIHIVTEHLPPYQIESSNKPLSGFAVDVIQETMARSHYAYSLKSYSWIRSYKLAQKKVNYCIFSLARLKLREKLFKWVGPISQVNNTALWTLKGQNIVINNIDDAKKHTIAVNQDDIAHIGLLERGFLEDENLYIADNKSSLIKLLITRPEIDLIVASDSTMKLRSKMADTMISKLQRVYEIKDLPLNFFFACSNKTDDKIIKHLAKHLQSLYQDGTYYTIWNKWQNELVSKK